MRVIRNGIVAFGLVNIPVGLASTTSEKKVEFRKIHRKCKTGLKQQVLTCPTCEAPVPEEEIVRGFEYEKDTFVTFEEDELGDLLADRDPIITVSKFVDAEEVKGLYVKQTYILLPKKLLSRPYEVLENAMMKTGLTALGSSSLWGKESPTAIVADGGILRLQLLWCADEIASTVDAGENLTGKVTPGEVALAEDIVRAMYSDLDPATDLVSKTRVELTDFINTKLSGQKIERAESDEKKLDATIDLMGALRASVESARKKPTTRKPTTKKAPARKRTAVKK